MKTDLKNITELRIDKIVDDDDELAVFRLENLTNEIKSTISSSHRVDFNEMILVTEGEGEVCIDLQNYRYSPNTLISVSRGQIQAFEGINNLSGYLIVFSDQFYCSNDADYEWMLNLHLFRTRDFSPIINLSSEDFEELLHYAKLLRAEVKSNKTFARETLLRNMLKILILKAECYKRNKSGYPTETNSELKLFQEFRQKLENHYYENRSVRFYADSLFITARKLNQITLMYLGKNAKDVIEERILLEIKRRLIHTELTVKEISQNIGFKDPTNFNKFFKRFMQTSPAKYRSEGINTD